MSTQTSTELEQIWRETHRQLVDADTARLQAKAFADGKAQKLADAQAEHEAARLDEAQAQAFFQEQEAAELQTWSAWQDALSEERAAQTEREEATQTWLAQAEAAFAQATEAMQQATLAQRLREATSCLGYAWGDETDHAALEQAADTASLFRGKAVDAASGGDEAGLLEAAEETWRQALLATKACGAGSDDGWHASACAAKAVSDAWEAAAHAAELTHEWLTPNE